MSWFKTKPKHKEPPKHIPHHFNSPMSDMLLEQTKQRIKEPVGEKDKPTRNKNESK